MPLLCCIVRPHKLDDVLRTLEGLPVKDVTASEVRGFGRQKDRLDLYRGKEPLVSFLPKARVECWVEPEDVAAAVTAIREAAVTGQPGDGKIFVLPLEGRLEV